MSGDFTSARFLGSGPITPAATPGSGKPAILAEPEGAEAVARLAARRAGTTDALLARSTLHALVDVLSVEDPPLVVLDEHAYPISGWAAAAARGGEGLVVTYRHHDARDASRALRLHRGPAVVLADAWCAACLRPAPLAELARAARRAGALLVVDDSLAHGVLGARADARDLLGSGAGGTLAWLGVHAPATVCVASASKAFGSGVCVVTGPSERVHALRERGPTRVHASAASPGDVALLHAGLVWRAAGERRRRLARLVADVRGRAADAGLEVVGDPFPIVGVRSRREPAASLHQALAARGIRTLVTRSECAGVPMLTLCLRADHRDAEINELVDALTAVHGRGAA